MLSSVLRVERPPQRLPTLVAVPPSWWHHCLLRALPPELVQRISTHLEFIELRQRTVLHEAGAPFSYACFQINPIVSLLYMLQNGHSAQTAMVGFEGMVVLSPFMGCRTSHGCAVMLSTAAVLKLRARARADELASDLQTVQLLLRYAQSLFIQLAQSAVCHRHHSTEDQLCRWLLTASDHLARDELHMIQGTDRQHDRLAPRRRQPRPPAICSGRGSSATTASTSRSPIVPRSNAHLRVLRCSRTPDRCVVAGCGRATEQTPARV